MLNISQCNKSMDTDYTDAQCDVRGIISLMDKVDDTAMVERNI